jgi:hypothetical protein
MEQAMAVTATSTYVFAAPDRRARDIAQATALTAVLEQMAMDTGGIVGLR